MRTSAVLMSISDCHVNYSDCTYITMIQAICPNRCLCSERTREVFVVSADPANRIETPLRGQPNGKDENYNL
jgi:hypothetical protein